MPLDGITLNSVVQELTSTLTGGRVDKVTQPEPDELIIPIRSQGKNHKLLLTANANSPRLHLTKIHKTNPDKTYLFNMLLRKHLGGGRIRNITQPDFERIVEIHVDSPNELGDMSLKRLIIEIMGKHSNIILVDYKGNIMDSIRHVSREISSVREVLPGRPYVRPPSQMKVAPYPVDEDYFLKVTDGAADIQKAIYKAYNGISPAMASEIIRRGEKLGKKGLLTAFSALYDDVVNGRFDCRIYERDFSAVAMGIYDEEGEAYESPSEMLETYYVNRDSRYRIAQKTADLRKLLTTYMERCRRKSQIYDETLKDIEDREQLRHYGELITSYIYAIPEGVSSAKVSDFYNDNQETEIPLDPLLSPAENAQRYFKGYNKAKRTYLALQEQMQSNESDIEYLDSVLAAMLSVTSEEDIAEVRAELAEQGFVKKKQQKVKGNKKSKPLRYQSSDGLDIYVGKNNSQNDELTLRFANSADVWLHTKEIAGSHVIIRGDGREISETSIVEAAMLAAYYSKARQSSQVPVDYTLRRHVRKPKGAKPGFVIYDFHKTVYVTPSEKDLPKQII